MPYYPMAGPLDVPLPLKGSMGPCVWWVPALGGTLGFSHNTHLATTYTNNWWITELIISVKQVGRRSLLILLNPFQTHIVAQHMTYPGTGMSAAEIPIAVVSSGRRRPHRIPCRGDRGARVVLVPTDRLADIVNHARHVAQVNGGRQFPLNDC